MIGQYDANRFISFSIFHGFRLLQKRFFLVNFIFMITKWHFAIGPIYCLYLYLFLKVIHYTFHDRLKYRYNNYYTVYSHGIWGPFTFVVKKIYLLQALSLGSLPPQLQPACTIVFICLQVHHDN